MQRQLAHSLSSSFSFLLHLSSSSSCLEFSTYVVQKVNGRAIQATGRAVDFLKHRSGLHQVQTQPAQTRWHLWTSGDHYGIVTLAFAAYNGGQIGVLGLVPSVMQQNLD